jgi:hypothetical protein
MVELRCNSCSKNVKDYCTKLKLPLVNGFAKLYYGGAIGIYGQNKTYPSKCKVDLEAAKDATSECVVTTQETYVTSA